MIKKFGFYLTILIAISLSSCSTVKAMGVFYQENTENQDWIRFYTLTPRSNNSELELNSNFSLSGNYKMIAIDPRTKTNRAYWVRPDYKIYRSYEDSSKQVSAEQYYKNFKLPENVIQIFIDWSGRTKDKWRSEHFIYFITDDGKIWAINDKTETAERAWENITIPASAVNVSLVFNNEEYPVVYKRNKKPIRVNMRTGLEQVILDINVSDEFLIDQKTGAFYEINSTDGLILYLNNGERMIVDTKIIPLCDKIIAPTIINGFLFFGINENEEVVTGRNYL